MLDALILVLATLAVLAWFGGWPPPLPASVPATLLAIALLARTRPWAWRPRWPRPETAVCVAAAFLFRVPALLHPWGWVNRDGAYGAFVALHLLQGMRPAPVFTEGANYQGTLKAHLAAALHALTPLRDLSLLMTIASLLLYLVFVAATVALARRIAGPRAGLFAGLFVAISPRFLTVFSLNCVGQYMDVLALAGVALALVATVLDQDLGGRAAGYRLFAAGLLLGAALWQQPVALPYLGCVVLLLAARRRSWSDRWTLAVLPGLALGVLPVLIWNAHNGWSTADVVGRDQGALQAQAEALPVLLRRTLTISFPVLMGLSPNHPWRAHALVPWLAALLPPAALLGAVLVPRRAIASALRERRVPVALAPVLLALLGLLVFWAVAAGRVYVRPRYLLPVLAAIAVCLGVSLAGLARISRVLAACLGAAILALNLSASVPRLRQGAAVAAPYQALVRSLADKGIRTGYADFSQAAPVTMFTAEKILLSPKLGPTPYYASDVQEERVRREGPDAYVLRAEDDPRDLAAVLDGLGVTYTLDLDPVPVFHHLSRRVAIDEVLGFAGDHRVVGGEDQ